MTGVVVSFRGRPRGFVPVAMGAPQGSPLCPRSLRFELFFPSLTSQPTLPKLIITVWAPPSYRSNTHHLQSRFQCLHRRALSPGSSFLITKTQVIPPVNDPGPKPCLLSPSCSRVPYHLPFQRGALASLPAYRGFTHCPQYVRFLGRE